MKLFYKWSKACVVFLCFILFFQRCEEKPKSFVSDRLKIIPISKNTYIHESYLQTQSFGLVPCNGLIFVSGKEAIVFDTPTNDSASVELLNWVQSELSVEVKAVIIGHSHDDCLGGLKVFHDSRIPSFANELTKELARKKNEVVPMNGFGVELVSYVGEDSVISTFLGQGHTKDNIVSYIPAEKVLFGGCLIKEINGTKGYVEEGNVNDWSGTVRKVNNRFSNIETVVPGHGQYGTKDLLDYTISLFSEYEVKE